MELIDLHSYCRLENRTYHLDRSLAIRRGIYRRATGATDDVLVGILSGIVRMLTSEYNNHMRVRK